MTLTLEQALAIAVPCVAALTWLIRLEGRINVNDSRHDDIVERLKRIETKLDRGNGH